MGVVLVEFIRVDDDAAAIATKLTLKKYSNNNNNNDNNNNLTPTQAQVFFYSCFNINFFNNFFRFLFFLCRYRSIIYPQKSIYSDCLVIEIKIE